MRAPHVNRKEPGLCSNWCCQPFKPVTCESVSFQFRRWIAETRWVIGESSLWCSFARKTAQGFDKAARCACYWLRVFARAGTHLSKPPPKTEDTCAPLADSYATDACCAHIDGRGMLGEYGATRVAPVC